MVNPFGTGEMAAGYATSRPPVHPRVIERVCRRLDRTAPFSRALDVGCGAGISTRALDGVAAHAIGLDPAAAMLPWAARVAPGSLFLAGAAEALPFRARSFDLITAAGSLNYADLDRFFAEAARVLDRHGVLVVYDFSPGRTFRDAPGLDEWFTAFHRRYPPPAHEALELNPATLAARCQLLRLEFSEAFEIGPSLSPAFYLDYVLTETNVADAVRRGVLISEIRRWCAATLAPVWQGAEREVLFPGYFTCFRAG
jgi:SAM-dependent methyltransferase